MPKFANVNQTQQPFPVRPMNSLSDRNMFDLSHDHKTTFTMGKLVPILTVETMPGDTFYIRGEYMMRFAPLYLPIMHKVNFEVAYFYVPYRILWPGSSVDNSWEGFIMTSPAADTWPTPPFTIVPTVEYDYGSAGEVAQYMGFPTILNDQLGLISQKVVRAYNFSAYLYVWDEFYRNDQVQDKKWFPLTSGTNTAEFNAVPGFETYQCLYRNWNRDYYTSATPTPQLGADIQVPMVTPTDINGTIVGGPTRWRKITDDTLSGGGDLQTDANSVSQVAGIADVYLDIQETAATIREFRHAAMMTAFLEAAMRAGDKYQDHTMMFWNVDPTNAVINRPQFIGAKHGRVVVSEVMSTAETLDSQGAISSYVGSYAGQALALDSTNNTFEYTCKEFGVILGIISVYPDSSYMQGLERMWTRAHPVDFPWIHFALTGDDAIQNQEVQLSFFDTGDASAWNLETFAYIPKYSDWRYKNDLYSGGMRKFFTSFHLGRIFTDADQAAIEFSIRLNDSFLECKPRVTDVFQIVSGEDEIYAHIFNDVKVLRKLPKRGIPAL